MAERGIIMNKLLIVLLLGLPGASALAQVNIPLPKNPTPLGGPAQALPSGLYVSVIEGLISVTNKGGTQNFAAGQFGFTPTPSQPPVLVPKNPGLLFTLPTGFTAAALPNTSTSTPPKSNAVDCEVR
jgi:hypothetical protein